MLSQQTPPQAPARYPGTGAAVVGKDTERVIAAVWDLLLETRGVGSRDNFFEMGGNSLAAMRMAVRVGYELGYEIPLGLVFDHPVLADFAQECDRVRVEGSPAVEPIRPRR